MDIQTQTTLPRIAFSLTEFAVATGLSLSTVQRRVATGELPTVKIGRRRLVPREALERLFIGQERAA